MLQVPLESPEISDENIRLGNGSAAVSADAEGDTYTTTVDPDVALRELLVGHTVPGDKEIGSVTLDGETIDDYRVRRTTAATRFSSKPRRTASTRWW